MASESLPVKVLVVDNYDSFTYNLVQYLGIAGAETIVLRNDAVTAQEALKLGVHGIMLSPGPCTPNQAGVCIDLSRLALSGELQVPLFGVCLGHQTVAQVAGATVSRAGQIRHGKASPISHDGKGLFAHIPSPFSAIRYHSLIVRRETVPEEFIVTAASDDDNEVMGIRHRSLPIEAVQFHPESALTEHGHQMIENFVAWIQPRES